MESNVAGATVFASSYSHISKRADVPAIIVSLCMLLVGLILFVMVWQSDTMSSTVSLLCIVVGTGLFLWTIFRLFWQSSVKVYVPTGSVVRERILYFGQDALDNLTESVETGDWRKALAARPTPHGSVRLDVLASKDGRFAAVQLFRFVPHTYVPSTAVRVYVGDEAAEFIGFLSHC